MYRGGGADDNASATEVNCILSNSKHVEGNLSFFARLHIPGNTFHVLTLLDEWWLWSYTYTDDDNMSMHAGMHVDRMRHGHDMTRTMPTNTVK